MRLLRRLRALNKEDYKVALEALQINSVKHVDPFDFGTGTEADVKKKQVKDECYQVSSFHRINAISISLATACASSQAQEGNGCNQGRILPQERKGIVRISREIIQFGTGKN